MLSFERIPKRSSLFAVTLVALCCGTLSVHKTSHGARSSSSLFALASSSSTRATTPPTAGRIPRQQQRQQQQQRGNGKPKQKPAAPFRADLLKLDLSGRYQCHVFGPPPTSSYTTGRRSVTPLIPFSPSTTGGGSLSSSSLSSSSSNSNNNNNNVLIPGLLVGADYDFSQRRWGVHRMLGTLRWEFRQQPPQKEGSFWSRLLPQRIDLTGEQDLCMEQQQPPHAAQVAVLWGGGGRRGLLVNNNNNDNDEKQPAGLALDPMIVRPMDVSCAPFQKSSCQQQQQHRQQQHRHQPYLLARVAGRRNSGLKQIQWGIPLLSRRFHYSCVLHNNNHHRNDGNDDRDDYNDDEYNINNNNNNNNNNNIGSRPTFLQHAAVLLTDSDWWAQSDLRINALGLLEGTTPPVWWEQTATTATAAATNNCDTAAAAAATTTNNNNNDTPSWLVARRRSMWWGGGKQRESEMGVMEEDPYPYPPLPRKQSQLQQSRQSQSRHQRPQRRRLGGRISIRRKLQWSALGSVLGGGGRGGLLGGFYKDEYDDDGGTDDDDDDDTEGLSFIRLELCMDDWRWGGIQHTLGFQTAIERPLECSTMSLQQIFPVDF